MEQLALKFENDLTTRQWILYNFLKRKYVENKDRYISLKEIYTFFKHELLFDTSYQFLHWKDNYPQIDNLKNWNNQTARRQITEDINKLKLSEILHANVISNVRGVKIASEVDIEEIIKEKISILKSLKRINSQLKKSTRNMQERLVFNEEINFIDTYLTRYQNQEEMEGKVRYE